MTRYSGEYIYISNLYGAIIGANAKRTSNASYTL